MDVQRLLQEGFSPEDIIKHLSQAFPKFGKKLNYAQQAGYTANQIMNFLGNLTGSNIKKIDSSTQGPTDLQSARKQSREGGPEGRFLKRLPSIIGPAIGMGAAAYGIGKIAPKVIPALARSLPTAAQEMLGIGGTGASTAAAPSVPPTGAAAQGIGAAVSQDAQAAKPITGIIEQMGDKVKGIIESLKGAQDPETIAAVLEQKILSPGQKKWLSQQTEQPLAKIVSDYLALSPAVPKQEAPQAVEEPLISPKVQQPAGQIPQEEKAQQAVAQIPPTPEIPKTKATEELSKPGSQVQLPSGDIGKIKNIKNGIAHLEVNGKDRHVKADELEAPALPEKELADLFNDLTKGIEKETGEEISRMAGFVGYDAEAKELAFRAHTGAAYTFIDIDPEDAEFLKNAATMRKTSGENYIGPWEKDTKSVMGNKMSQLFQKYKARAKEGEKAHHRKYEPIYDPFEVAHNASKAKKKAQHEAAKGPKKAKKSRRKNP